MWTLHGERVPAEHIMAVYLTYFPVPESYVLGITALDPQSQIVSQHPVQVGGTGNEMVRALRELARQLDWALGRKHAEWIARRWFGEQAN